MNISPIRSICCIGAGYVGGPTMAVIADRCPQIDVTVVDLNEERISAWNSDDLKQLPVYEPGLDQVINRTRGRNLYFSTSIEASIKSADMVFISVNTPTKLKGLGAGQASDLKWVEACARQVANYASGHTIVVEKSTLPVRTAVAIKTILSARSTQPDPLNSNEDYPTFSVLSNPEFLAEGTAIKDLEEPDRVLIGGEDPLAVEALALIYENWVPSEIILRTNLWSSELSKLTANAFLAQRISSINSVSALCEATGADIAEVSLAIGTDSRIGTKFLNAGPGFGGSCFKKDILNLVYLSNYFGLPEVGYYWQQVVTLNDWQQKRIAQLVVKKLFGTVSGKKLAILGFAFKANTNDTREAPAISIALELIEEGAFITIHDPKVESSQVANALGCEPTFNNKISISEGEWLMVSSVEEAVTGADAVLILTEWDEYKKLNWANLSRNMRTPSWVFDTRGIVDITQVKSAGLNFWRVGQGED